MKQNIKFSKAYLIFLIGIIGIIIVTIIYQMISLQDSDPIDGDYIREYVYFPYEIMEVYPEYRDDIKKYGTYNLKGMLSKKSDINTHDDLIENGWVFKKLPIPLIRNRMRETILDTNVPFDKDLISAINKYDYYWYYSDGTFTSLELSERPHYSNFDFWPMGNKLLIVLIPSQGLIYYKHY
ncbi:MAG: hypothetical protein IJJ23_08990 [Clostridia bacterium]|nr:hypothetical protein [Clostridia bacterium]